MSIPCIQEERCTCVRAVIRCTGLEAFPEIPKDLRGRLSKVDLRESSISTLNTHIFEGYRIGTVFDLRDQSVTTSFCHIRESRVQILYDEAMCSMSSTHLPSPSPVGTSTTVEPWMRMPTKSHTTPVSLMSLRSRVTTITTTTTTANYSRIFTGRRPGMQQMGPNQSTTGSASRKTTQGPANTSSEDTTSEMPHTGYKEYVLVIIIVISIGSCCIIISIIICYCICSSSEVHCKCCHKQRQRRFSGESLELFSHQVPENLPNLRYRVKEM